MDWSNEEIVKIIYRLLNVKGIGNVQANRWLWSLPHNVQNALQLDSYLGRLLSSEQSESFEQDYVLTPHSPEAGYFATLDDKYPKSLLYLLKQNAPSVLSCMGNLELLDKEKVGVCGSRKASEKGLWIAQDCATQLANNGVCIVSGYANGVDMVAHKTALKNGGDTIIVLPEGIDAFQIKQDLQEVWDWNRVLVISEFLPRDVWMASRAMKRNQTIIALSDVMLVIEAGETGGSLDAGMQTLSFGKPLFVPVFSQIPESARGNELLFAKGARSLKQKKETSRSNIDGLLLAIHHPMTEPELVFD